MTSGNKGIDYARTQAENFTSYYFETSNTKPLAYGIMSGDFDGAGGSYGIIQWNWKYGTLQPILRDLVNLHTADVQASFTVTADYNKFVDVVLNYSTADQMAWGTSITHYTSFNGDGTPVKSTGRSDNEPWNTYFKTLGTFKSCQDRQEAAVKPYFNLADGWCSDFGLWSRRGYSLAFDIAVQGGGMTTACHTDIMNFIAALPTTNLTPELRELYVMRYFANRRSDDVTSSFTNTFRDRKLAIANGSESVYGVNVDTVPYDLILEPNGLVALPPLKNPTWITI